MTDRAVTDEAADRHAQEELIAYLEEFRRVVLEEARQAAAVIATTPSASSTSLEAAKLPAGESLTIEEAHPTVDPASLYTFDELFLPLDLPHLTGPAATQWAATKTFVEQTTAHHVQELRRALRAAGKDRRQTLQRLQEIAYGQLELQEQLRQEVFPALGTPTILEVATLDPYRLVSEDLSDFFDAPLEALRVDATGKIWVTTSGRSESLVPLSRRRTFSTRPVEAADTRPTVEAPVPVAPGPPARDCPVAPREHYEFFPAPLLPAEIRQAATLVQLFTVYDYDLVHVQDQATWASWTNHRFQAMDENAAEVQALVRLVERDPLVSVPEIRRRLQAVFRDQVDLQQRIGREVYARVPRQYPSHAALLERFVFAERMLEVIYGRPLRDLSVDQDGRVWTDVPVRY